MFLWTSCLQSFEWVTNMYVCSGNAMRIQRQLCRFVINQLVPFLTAGQYVCGAMLGWCQSKTRWWFQFFYFHPYLGKIPILPNIFQMGWFNHQPKKGNRKVCFLNSHPRTLTFLHLRKALLGKGKKDQPRPPIGGGSSRRFLPFVFGCFFFTGRQAINQHVKFPTSQLITWFLGWNFWPFLFLWCEHQLVHYANHKKSIWKSISNIHMKWSRWKSRWKGPYENPHIKNPSPRLLLLHKQIPFCFFATRETVAFAGR